MEINLGSGYTYHEKAHTSRCEECPPGAPILPTISFSDGNGYGGTYCRRHSMRVSRVDLGMEKVEEVVALWNMAESQARRLVPFEDFCGQIRRIVGREA